MVLLTEAAAVARLRKGGRRKGENLSKVGIRDFAFEKYLHLSLRSPIALNEVYEVKGRVLAAWLVTRWCKLPTRSSPSLGLLTPT